MAGTIVSSRRGLGVTSSAPLDYVVNDLIVQHNLLVGDLDAELMPDHALTKAAVDQQKRAFINAPLATATVAIGTTVQKVRTTATATFRIDGVFKSKASTDDFWTLSGTTIADGFVNKYLLCIDADGAASIVEGTQAATAGAVVLGAWPASKSVLGILTVATTGAAFVPGTTGLDAAEVTDTYTDGFDAALIADGPATAAGLTAAKIGTSDATEITF